MNLCGRKIGERLRAGTPLHLYLPERDGLNPRGVWNPAALAASQEIILREALIDALTFWCAGYRNVATAYGMEGFTDELLEAFRRHGTQRVLIAFDRDEPGERSSQKVAERLMARGIECVRIQFPRGMDANDDARKVTPAPNAEVPCKVTEAAVHFTFHDRRCRVRGLAKNAGGEVLKVNLMASRLDAFFVDSLDLYSARQRGGFVTQAALELQLTDDIVRADVGRVLRKLEDLQEAALAKTLTAQETSQVALSAEEQTEALELPRSPDLVERIGADLAACGMVGCSRRPAEAASAFLERRPALFD